MINRSLGPAWNSFNIHHDYAVVVFPATDGRLKTYLGTLVPSPDYEIALDSIEPVQLASPNYVLDLLFGKEPVLFTRVGYGINEHLAAPGTGGNAGGAGSTRGYGERWVSEYTAALNTSMLDQSMLVGFQNPALGYEGTCSGDSGEPNFVTSTSGAKVQIGVTSSGDRRCRGTTIISRLDIPGAQEFLSCTVNARSPSAFAACGCTTLNPRTGTCAAR